MMQMTYSLGAGGVWIIIRKTETKNKNEKQKRNENMILSGRDQTSGFIGFHHTPTIKIPHNTQRIILYSLIKLKF